MSDLAQVKRIDALAIFDIAGAEDTSHLMRMILEFSGRTKARYESVMGQTIDDAVRLYEAVLTNRDLDRRRDVTDPLPVDLNDRDITILEIYLKKEKYI